MGQVKMPVMHVADKTKQVNCDIIHGPLCSPV